MDDLRFIVGACGNDPAALALQAVGGAIVPHTVAVMDGNRHDRGTDAAPELALRVNGSGLDAAEDILVDRRVGFGNQQGHGILGLRTGVIVIRPRRDQIDIGQAAFTGQNTGSNIVIHRFVSSQNNSALFNSLSVERQRLIQGRVQSSRLLRPL